VQLATPAEDTTDLQYEKAVVVVFVVLSFEGCGTGASRKRFGAPLVVIVIRAIGYLDDIVVPVARRCSWLGRYPFGFRGATTTTVHDAAHAGALVFGLARAIVGSAHSQVSAVNFGGCGGS
jgi:hypothetical protein